MTAHTRVLFLAVLLPGLLGACQPEAPDTPASYRFAEAWGTSGTEPGQFRNPIGIARTDAGEIVVSEAKTRRLQVLDRTGTPLRQIGPALPGGDSLRRPMHIAAAGSTLYVPDFNTDRVHVLSLQGSPRDVLDPMASGAGFDAPGGVAADGTGRVYVADFYHHRVLRFGTDGALDRQWGTTDSSGTAPARFTYPTDVAALPDGGFVVADAYNHRIKRYDDEGALAWRHPKEQTWSDSTKGRFNVATAVATGPDGHIFVADFYNHRIQEFTAAGRLVRTFGEKGTGEGQFERPVDVAVGANDTLYVVDFGNDRIQVFAPDA